MQTQLLVKPRLAATPCKCSRLSQKHHINCMSDEFKSYLGVAKSVEVDGLCGGPGECQPMDVSWEPADTQVCR